MSELRQAVLKSVIITQLHLLVLWYKLFNNARTCIILKLLMPSGRDIHRYKNSVSLEG